MASRWTQPSENAGRSESSQSTQAPMWVVRVQHVLEMTGKPPPHQILKTMDLLEIFAPMMRVMFVSHQWLSFHHPDPNGQQLQVLQEFLKNFIAKRLKIEQEIAAAFFRRTPLAKQLDGVAEGYIWLDYFCVPQQEGVGLKPKGLAEEQLLYVKSIPSFVDRCNMFVALVPHAWHCDTEETSDNHSWLQRGWCRTELWCHVLSTRSKLPVIEVKSPQAVQFSTPLWHRYPVHTGDFAIEMDRASCSHVVEIALSKYVAKLRKSNKTTYRLYLSLFEQITGSAPKLRSLEDFVSEFDFPKSLQQYKGLGPAACAALSGDEDLLRRVVEAKASVHTHAPRMPEIFHCPDFQPLDLTLFFRSHDLRILKTLLELRANPHSSTINDPPSLGLCQTVGAVDLLVRSRAGVNFRGKQVLQFSPLQYATALAAPPEVIGRLLELRADVCGGRGGFASASPLHCVAHSGDSQDDLRNAQLLIDNGADVNQIIKVEGLFKILELVGRASQCRNDTSSLLRFFSQLSATPLGYSAFFGNCGMLALLLRARADPEIRGNTGLRPVDMARWDTVRSVLLDPRPHIYRIEHQSELVTETL